MTIVPGKILKRILTKIFGPKKKELSTQISVFHSVELHDLYGSPSIVRML